MATSESSRQFFHDAIHGPMEFPPVCVDIINTIQFQRLRNIKQLGLVYYVYPSASHNRFEHCLGTCHLAGKLVRHLNEEKKGDKISDEDILCVEIAALCHDLGHGPFSHAFQEIINEYRKEREMEKWEHEDASCKMLEHLINENPHIKQKDLDIQFIKELITGKQVNSGKPPYLFQIVNNASYNIDVDKWDYLARDSHFLGFGNSFDHERMIKSSTIIDNNIRYRDKTLDNFYDMFYTQYRLHKTAYQHKTVLLFNKLLGEAFKDADRELNIFAKVEDMKEFTYFTDSILEEILKNENCNEAQQKLKDIIDRSYKYEGQVPVTCEENDQDRDQGKIFCLANFDYGDKGENPLLKIPFYTKDSMNKTFNSDELKKFAFPAKQFSIENQTLFQKEKKQVARLKKMIRSIKNN